MRRTALLVAAVAGMGFGVSRGAHAVPQFTPVAGDSLHTIFSGEPGAQWNTAAPGGLVSYSSGTQQLSITAVLDILNYWNPGNGSCPTDVGSNCSYNYGVPTGADLDITLAADLHSVVVTDLTGGFYLVEEFKASAPLTLESFTAEANGQVFKTDSGEFVPEPGAALLLGLGCLGLAARAGRR